MKNVFLLCSLFLIACNNQNQTITKDASSHEKAEIMQTSISNSEIQAENSIPETNQLEDTIEKVTLDQVLPFNCSNLSNENLVAFNDTDMEPKCEVFKNINNEKSHCEVFEDAFGGEKDPLVLDSQDKRIFVFKSLDDCNTTLEIRNSNAP